MGYLHINQLYKDQTILLFKECWALEKIHGTSAHISWRPNGLDVKFNGIPMPIPHSNGETTTDVYPEERIKGNLTFFSGGESHEKFMGLFDKQKLDNSFYDLGIPCDKTITVYGEAYGGKQQGMSHTYGKELKFVVFDIQIGDCWLDVPNASQISQTLGLDFVHYVKIPTDLKTLDAERDANSVQAVRNGVVEPRKREGVILRPLVEMTLNNGNRVICKHKGDDFRETASPRVVDDPAKLRVLADADAVANEYVTLTRLEHVLDKIEKKDGFGMELVPVLLKAMVEDVTREASGEIVDSEAVRKAITKKTATMFKDYLKAKLTNGK